MFQTSLQTEEAFTLKGYKHTYNTVISNVTANYFIAIVVLERYDG